MYNERKILYTALKYFVCTIGILNIVFLFGLFRRIHRYFLEIVNFHHCKYVFFIASLVAILYNARFYTLLKVTHLTG